MERTMPQKLLAEFVGAFTLIFIGAGAIMHTGGQNLVAIALAHGLAIATMVSAMGHISGAHFNPAITISAWVTQKIGSRDAISYVVAQLAGATAAALLLMMSLPASIWERAGSGTPAVNAVLSNGQGVLIEAILTFFLVWVVFATAIDSDGAFNKIAGLAIGFVILMDILMGGGLTGAAMNPARHFGPALVSGNWGTWWVYWIGPIAGGIIAASLYDTMILRARVGEGSAAGEANTHDPGPHEVGARGDTPTE
jgi:aquaporin Z